MTANTKEPSQEQLSILLEYYQSGRFAHAEKLSKSLTKEFPKHQFGWKLLGVLYGQSGRNSEAVNVKQTAVALSPQDAEAHNNLGNMLKELGRVRFAGSCQVRHNEHNNLKLIRRDLRIPNGTDCRSSTAAGCCSTQRR